MKNGSLIRAILVTSAALPLFAGTPWPLPLFSSDPKAVLEAADKRPASTSAGVILLDYQATFRFLANGQIGRTQHLVYRVINDSGAKQLSKISQAWLSWRVDKPTIRARVITRDGIAHMLDSHTITEAGVPAQVEGLYSDLKVLNAPLPAVAPGAVVEIAIEHNDRETVNPGGALEQVNFASDIPIQYLKLTLEAPAGVPLHIEERHTTRLERKETSSGNQQRVGVVPSAETNS